MENKFKNKNKYQIFISYFKPHIKLFLLDMTCALIISMIDLAFPFISRWCMYKLLPEGAFKLFFAIMFIFLIVYIFRSVCTFIIGYFGHRFGILVETDIRADVFKHIQTLGFDYFDNIRVGQLLSRLTTDLFDITELAHHGPEDLFISSVTIIGAIIIMFTIEWRLALVIAIMLPIFLLIVWKFRFEMMLTAKKVKKMTSLINADFESNLSGIRTAKAFANENQEYDKFEKANINYRNAKYAHYKAMSKFTSVMEFCMSILSVIVIGVGGTLIMLGKMNVIDLITFSLYISTFLTPVRKLANTAELFSNGLAGLERFTELMNTESKLIDAKDAKALVNVKGEINIDNISFSYDNIKEVIKNISLDIKQGETLALVGPSGGGKTTLVQLILRFYDVTKGHIYIDSQDIKNVTQESIHKNIGVVQQDVFLFPTTIEENIKYGRLDATHEEVVEAAKMAEIYDDIMHMPNLFNTNVGDRGVLLSGGQKQRIAIARIFLKNPPILILDEATSALDSVTEIKIQKTFDKLAKGRTTIIIAHRLSTVRNANRIAVIENGEIKEIGTHSELINQDSLYKKLVNSQEFINK